MELIAGDIGGTKSWLAWAAAAGDGGSVLRHEAVYRSADFSSGTDLLRHFIDEARQPAMPASITLALPGPLDARRVRLTNLDWTLDADELQTTLGVAEVRFLNDFQAAAAGVATLTAADVVVLNAGAPQAGGVRAITGAGTGLGLAFMVAAGKGHYQSHPSEGGHIDFAPADARQARLLEGLRARHGHVSWERVVSGSALGDLYAFCCAEHGQAPPAVALDGAALSARAEAGDAVADAALDLFVDLYGAWVGNVALLYQPFGGLYIAGGVATHMQGRMRSPRFMAAAADKGRMRDVVERTPIFLITCNRLGVQGALAHALTPPPTALPQHRRSAEAGNEEASIK